MRSTASNRLVFATLALVAISVSGCSSMSKTECLAVDWRTIGYEDGVAGYPGNHIAKHRKACAKHGVRSDLALYQEGRAQGLQEYCQPVNGYRLGVRGGGYGGVCPAELESPFLAAFEAGHELYSLRARVANAEAQLDAKRRELDRAKHGIVANSAAVVSDESTQQERADALVDTAELSERIGRLKEEIRQLENDRVRYERDLDDYLANQPPTY
jgi:uncharacterized small protein (DUF1192 family)